MQQSPVIFDCVWDKPNSVMRANFMIMVASSLSQNFVFLKMFLFTLKDKAGVLKFLQFEKRFEKRFVTDLD